MSQSIDLNSYIDNVDLDKVPQPDWNDLDVTFKETIKLPWDKIHIDPASNDTKVEAHTSQEIEVLRLSFAKGVYTNEFPPAVVYQGKTYAKPWKLIYGFGRQEALDGLKTKEWVFSYLEGTEDAIEDVQAAENEGLPKRLNMEVDMRRTLIRKVTEGKIAKTETAVRAKFSKIYKTRPASVKNRVVAQVLEELSIPVPYTIYTSTAKIKLWLSQHSKEEYKIDGEFDKERDMFGVTMKEGYQYRTVLYAIKRFVEEQGLFGGKKTYVIGHCGAPTKIKSLAVKRKHIMEEFDAIKKNLMSLGMKSENWPIVYMGSLPQDNDNEDKKILVK